MTITALPTPPTRQDPASFATRGDDFLAALPVFVEEANALALAMNLNSTTDGSGSTNTLSTGAKTFTVTAGKSFQPGMYLVIADAAAPSANSMWGQVTSYAGTSLVVNILSYMGSGAKSAWVISQSAPGGVSLAGVETITNKTISGASNTLTNIPQTALAANVVGNGPAFYAHQSVGQVLAATTNTPVNLVSEPYDTNSDFNTVTSTFTCSVPGVYSFKGAAGAPIGMGALQLFISVNGSNVVSGGIFVADATLGLSASIAADLSLTAGQTVNMRIISKLAGTLNAGSAVTYFQGALARSA